MASSISLPSFAAVASNIAGRTDGNAPSAGFIGERISSATLADQVLTGSSTDWTNASVSLTPGSWHIFANASLICVTGNVSGDRGESIIKLTDSLDNVIQEQEKAVRAKTVAGVSNEVLASVTLSATVNISSTSTYKLRVHINNITGSGNGTALSQTSFRSNFYAIRIA